MRTALIFPGQGSQFTGMGKDFYDNGSVCKRYLDDADGLLGFPLKDLMFNGPEDKLTKTTITQPAIYVFSVMVFSELSEMGSVPGAVCGHSVGEYAAHFAAGSLSFTDGLNLVSKRSIEMEKAATASPGGMLAVLGMENEPVQRICSEVGEKYVLNIANINCPHQLVISGVREALEEAEIKLHEAGARKIVHLAVSGAWHSSLMRYAETSMEPLIRQTNFQTLNCPLYANISAESIKPADIAQSLIEQICSPVLFKESIENMIKDGYDTFIECGGKVLTGLIKRINREVKVVSIKTWDDVRKIDHVPGQIKT